MHSTRFVHGWKPLRQTFALFRVTTFLEFLETWKCQGIWLRSGKRPKVRENSGKGQGICVVVGNLIVVVQRNNLPVLYLYCSSFFHTQCSQRIFINKCAFVHILPSRKVGDFFLSGAWYPCLFSTTFRGAHTHDTVALLFCRNVRKAGGWSSETSRRTTLCR